MSVRNRWLRLLNRPVLIAILRGLDVGSAVSIGRVLVEAGFDVLEVPLNTPQAFDSIGCLAEAFGEAVLVGAGTVLRPGEVDTLHKVGGRICISPDANPKVIERAKALDLVSLPAFATPTEAFQAVEAGADGLKLFPAGVMGPEGLKAMKAVLPKDCPVVPVGGISPDTIAQYLKVGAAGFGIGSELYRPGDTVETVAKNAVRFKEAIRGDNARDT